MYEFDSDFLFEFSLAHTYDATNYLVSAYFFSFCIVIKFNERI